MSLFTSIFISSCGDSVGLHGRVFINANQVAPYALVQLKSINDRGTTLATLDKTIASEKGFFSLTSPRSPSLNLIIEAQTPSGTTLRAFACAKVIKNEDPPYREITVSPMSDAIVDAILDITSPSGGKTLTDFSVQKIEAVSTSAIQLEKENDPSSTQAAKTLLLANLGRDIATASGASITAATKASIEPTGSTQEGLSFTNPTSSSHCQSDQFYLFESKNFTFDLTPEGEICDGFGDLVSNAFNEGFQAQITNDTFVESGDNDYPYTANGSFVIVDDHTAVYEAKSTTGGVTLQRKIYVPEDDDFARYLEILKNPTSSEKTVDLRILGEVGSSTTTTMVVRGEDDPTSLSATDRFAASYGNYRQHPTPTVGYVWQDNNGISLSYLQFADEGNPDDFLFGWNDIKLSAGQTKTFVYYVWLSTERDPEVIRAALLEIAEHPDMTGMTSEELAGLQNFGPRLGNIVGEVGSVTAGATVTVTNETKNSSTTVTALSDWSFYAVVDAESGDTIHITATDGLDTTVTVP